MGSPDTAPRRYCGIVFKQGPATADFSCSLEVLLPGEFDTRRAAWEAVHAALLEPGGADLIGGEIRPA